MNNITVVIPTIRPRMLPLFLKKWEYQFNQYDIKVVIVFDGENPEVRYLGNFYSSNGVMGKYNDLIFNKNDGVRNLGFAFVAKLFPDTEYIISLDDDVGPYEDTIGNHLKALSMKVPVSWLSTASEYTRGFPYLIREEAEVVLSHGIWEGTKDYDAATQLVRGNPDVTFYKGPIPKGIFYPMSGMNLAFKRKMLPYMYFAPMGQKVGLDRFADIWCGIESKKIIDKNKWAVVTGYAKVLHERASNVFTNLQKEAKGIEANETFWKGDETNPYFKMYEKKRKRWQEFMKQSLQTI